MTWNLLKYVWQYLAGKKENGKKQFESYLQQAEFAENCYLQTNKLKHLEETIAAWENVVNSQNFAKIDEDLQTRVLINSGIAYFERFSEKDTLNDLECAISSWETALGLTSDNFPYLHVLMFY